MNFMIYTKHGQVGFEFFHKRCIIRNFGYGEREGVEQPETIYDGPNSTYTPLILSKEVTTQDIARRDSMANKIIDEYYKRKENEAACTASI